MNSRIPFYIIVVALVTLLGWAGYRLFFSNGAEKIAKSLSTPSKEDLQKKGSSAENNNVWNNESLRKTFGSDKMDGLKTTAEVENNIKNLTDLYNRGEDEELLKKALDLFEKNPEVKEYAAFLGDYYYNEGNWTEAEKYVKRLTELDPNNQFAKTTYGEVMAIQGKYDESLQTLESVLQKDPSNLQALYGLSSTYDMKGQPEVGIRRIEEMYKANPNNGNIAAVYADNLFAQGKGVEGHQALDQAMKNDPVNPAPMIRKSEILFSEGKPAEALPLLKAAVSKAATSAEKVIIYKKIVNQTTQSNDMAEAEEAAAAIRQLKPGSQDDRDAQRQIASAKETNAERPPTTAGKHPRLQ